MYCKICNQFFQPPPDEEKLIVTGAVEEICSPCAAKQWAKSVEGKPLPAPLQPGTEYRGNGTQLHRVDWFRPNGTSRAFIALPPKPLRPLPSPLRPKKAGYLPVTIMSERYCSDRQPTEPRITINTNLKRFREWSPPVLWIQKNPDAYDSFTGVGRIEVPASNVAEVVQVGNQVSITLVDGDSLRFLYR